MQERRVGAQQVGPCRHGAGRVVTARTRGKAKG